MKIIQYFSLLFSIGLRYVPQPGENAISGLDDDRLEQRVYTPEEVGLFVNQVTTKPPPKFKSAASKKGKG